ncbi:hypothetical protein MTP31_15330, partial [Klebsiella pneumoniae]
ITPSVAEQEGQQTETEATGAPQKHHYTLNQQVGSITVRVSCIPATPNAISSPTLSVNLTVRIIKTRLLARFFMPDNALHAEIARQPA